MDVFMLQGHYGPGGITAAMLRRSNEFIKNGLNCYAISLDFTENLYEFHKINEEKINKDIKFLNPFLELSNYARGISNQQFDIFKSFFSGQYEILETMKTNKMLLSVTLKKYEEDKKTKLYFSENGLCIAIEHLNKENESIAFITYNFSNNSINIHKNYYTFRTNWLYDTVMSSTGNDKVVICDGAGSVPKMKVFKNKNIKTFFVHHSLHEDSSGNITKSSNYIFQHADFFNKIVFLTKTQEDDARKKYNLTNTTTIPNFIIKKNYSRTEYSPNRIGFFARLVDSKGLKDSLFIMHILITTYKAQDIELHIYGDNENRDLNEVIAEYSKIANELGIIKNIFFHGFTSTPLEEMAKCMCVLFPSYRESQGLTILDAMQVGTPVVSYDCKYGPSQIITNNKNGFLCNIKDYVSMADRVYKLYSDKKLRSDMSEQCKKITERYDNTDIFYRWHDLFVS